MQQAHPGGLQAQGSIPRGVLEAGKGARRAQGRTTQAVEEEIGNMTDNKSWYQIYVATPAGKNSPCKIGCSSNPARRLKTLNCGRPDELELRAVIACPPGVPEWGSSSPYFYLSREARKLERDVHRELSAARLHGEWFDVDWQIAKKIASDRVLGREGRDGAGS